MAVAALTRSRLRSTPALLAGLALALHASHAGTAQVGSRVIRVSPGGDVPSIEAASRIARDGDVVEVQAGEYRGDTAVWQGRAITVRAVNGRARLVANGAAAEDKAIWVVRGDLTAENFDFVGARVPDGNGAGIRFEQGRLRVVNCVFEDNQNGILAGSDPDGAIVVERSVFRANGAGDGRTHNLYVAKIGSLVVRGSYFTQGRYGHLLKSGARETQILYSRLSDEPRGKASYELEFPYGGKAIVVGNLIQQDVGSDNRAIVAFGAEGYRWPENALYLSHNTIVNDMAEPALFVSVRSGDARAHIVNNVLVGKGDLEVRVPAEIEGNARVTWTELALPTRLDYRFKPGAAALHAVADPGMAGSRSLRPTQEYVHPAGMRALGAPQKLLPGAFQEVASPPTAHATTP